MANSYQNIGKLATTRRLNKILEDLKDDLSKIYLKSDPLQQIIDGLERIKKGDEEPKIKPLALYLDILEMIRRQSSLPSNFPVLVHNAEVIYDNLFLYGEDTPDFDRTVDIFKLLAGENGMVVKGFFDPFLFTAFADKSNYMTLIQVISTRKNALKIFDGIKTHALEVRPYLVDDEAYMSYLLKLVSRMDTLSPDEHGAFLEEELRKIQRSNGLYDIDPVRLAQVERNVQSAALTIESGRNILDAIDRRKRELEQTMQEMDLHSKEALASAQLYLETKVRNAREELDAELKAYRETQKTSIVLEKDRFLRELFADAEKELEKQKAIAKSITASAGAEVYSLSRDADDIINRLKTAADTDAKLLAASRKTQKDQELLDRITKLTLLNDTMIEQLGNTVPAASVAEAPVSVSPAVSVPKKARPIPPVNPLLDRNVPFKKRFDLAMKEKKRRMEKGELFHEMFDDVLTAVMEEVNPYLIGPSGCGKTYMVQQIGQILGIDLSDIGYINEEYDILGYVTAMGEYSESNFYWLYKYGGIAFCDELDNGNSKATVKLNSFLSNQQRASYCFPGGERVEKHPNFRVIAAGNTDGSGADLNYSTRERIEESVQQRMIPIYVDYDNRVEKAILKEYPDWFAFACAFRAATDHWSQVSGIPAQGIFTTRDSFRIRQYLDNGSFSPQKIMCYEFVQTKEPEYLGFLKEDIAKQLKKNSGAYAIYQLFANEIDRIRQTGKRHS